MISLELHNPRLKGSSGDAEVVRSLRTLTTCDPTLRPAISYMTTILAVYEELRGKRNRLKEAIGL